MLDPLFLGRGGAIVPVLTDELGRVLSLNSMILKRVRVLWTEAVQGSVKPRFWWRVGYLALRVSGSGSGTVVEEASRKACGVRPPSERWGRKVLNQWTHSAVAISTSSMPFQGPRFRMTSALNSEFRASASALTLL